MILIVDDEPSALVLLETVLRRENFVVRKATSGREALRILGRGDEHCSLVITDIRMPEMNGRELVAKMRANPRLAGIPVIMCTSTADRATVVELIGHGVRDYIVKPFNATSALSRVRAAIAEEEPVIEPKAGTAARLKIALRDYAPLADATVPMVDGIAIDLAEALRVRDARAARAVAERVKEPAEVFGANRAIAAAHCVMNAPGDLDVLDYASTLVSEIGELRSALRRVGTAGRA